MFKHLNTRIPKRIEQEKDKGSAVKENGILNRKRNER